MIEALTMSLINWKHGLFMEGMFGAHVMYSVAAGSWIITAGWFGVREKYCSS